MCELRLTPFYYVCLHTLRCHVLEFLNEQSNIPLQQRFLASKGLVAEGVADHSPLTSMRYIVCSHDAWWIAMDIWTVERYTLPESRCSMPVYVFPYARFVERQFIRCDSNYRAVLLVQIVDPLMSSTSNYLSLVR